VLRKDVKVEMISHVPLFATCSKTELRKIASLADEIDLPAGTRLTKEGASGKEFVVIVKGGADVVRRGKKLRSLGNGDFLGEIALVTGTPRTATVTTTEPTRALVIAAPAFRTLLRNTPSMQLKVLDALASRLPPETG
jgi:CRP/FNR family transcriptional regulator, cyclic AMP receptor protein